MKLSRLEHLGSRYVDAHKKAWEEKSLEPVIEANFKVLKKVAPKFINPIVSYCSENFDQRQEYKKILYIESTGMSDGWGLGDGIFKLPMLSDIRRHFGTCLSVFTAEHRRAIYENNPDIQKVLSLNEESSLNKFLSLLSLEKNNFDLFITTNPGNRMNLIKFFSNSKAPYVSIDNPLMPSNTINHIQKWREGAAEFFQYDISTPIKPKIYIPDTRKEWAKYVLRRFANENAVGISVGSRNALKKYHQWHKVIEIILDTNKEARVVLFGDEAAQEESRLIENRFPKENVKNMVGKTKDTTELYPLLNEMKVFSSTDGGSMNAAIALGKPTIGIFSVIKSEFILPSAPEHRENVIALSAECPFSKQRCHGYNYGFKCLDLKTDFFDYDKIAPCLHLSPESVAEVISSYYRSKVA